MATIAIQTAVGGLGTKATTEQSYNFASLLNLGTSQIGANSTGLYLLNDAASVETVSASFTLATTDFNIDNPKRIRKLLVSITTAVAVTYKIKYDNEATWRSYTKQPGKDDLQRYVVPIGMLNSGGRYITINVSSEGYFKIDSIKGIIITRSTGIGGYN